MKKLILLFVCLVLPQLSYAQKTASSIKPKTVVLKYDDELVLGNQKNSRAVFISKLESVRHKRLIQLRENFVGEVGRTSEVLH